MYLEKTLNMNITSACKAEWHFKKTQKHYLQSRKWVETETFENKFRIKPIKCKWRIKKKERIPRGPFPWPCCEVGIRSDFVFEFLFENFKNRNMPKKPQKQKNFENSKMSWNRNREIMELVSKQGQVHDRRLET